MPADIGGIPEGKHTYLAAGLGICSGLTHTWRMKKKRETGKTEGGRRERGEREEGKKFS